MTGTDNKIKFAVLGLGHIGKRHADMIKAHDDCSLVAVIDIDESATGSYNEPSYRSLGEFLSAGIDVDVICIATPNALHAAQAVDVLSAGCHVLIEKPIALTTTDCDNIIATAEQYGKEVFCVMQNRYSAPVQWLKQLLSQNLLGEVYMVHMNCFWNRDERYYNGKTWHGTADIDGGTLFTQFSHYVDLLYWLFGDVQDIQARFNNYNHKGNIDFEDSAIISFDLVNGGAGTINYSTSIWDKNMESSMVVIGEHGTVKLGGQYMQDIEYCHLKSEDIPELNNKELKIEGYEGAKANHWYVIENVVDVLNKKGTVATSVQEGKKIVNIIEQIYALKK